MPNGSGKSIEDVMDDLNNMLFVINNYADFVLSDLDDKEDLHNSIHEIQSAANRAISVTRQLLAFSRKQVMQPKIINLNQVVLEMEIHNL